MNPRVAFPFLRLSASAVTASPWQVSFDNAEWCEAPPFLPDWDYSRDIHVRRTMQVNLERAASDLQLLPTELHLSAGIRIGTGEGQLSRLIVARFKKEIVRNEPVWEFSQAICGRQLSTALDLHSEIILARAPDRPGELSPLHVADRVWKDSLRLMLEGDGARFPIEVADFRQLFADPLMAEAPWHLHWSPGDWERDIHSAARLYLNKNAQGFFDRITSQEDLPTIQVLLGDVMSQICERFVSDNESDDLLDSLEPGSLGAQAAGWLRTAWPGKSISYLRNMLETEPGVFRSTLLALAEQNKQ